MHWLDNNQRHLAAEVARIRHALTRALCEPVDDALPASDGAASALAALCEAFKLSPFERDVLLLCAAFELDQSISALCARADPARPFPTFALALAALDAPHWSALSPAAPLRFWHLIALQTSETQPLTASRLRVDERVLHYLVGINYLDASLAAIVKPLRDASGEAHATSAQQVAQLLRDASEPPVIQLCGDDARAKRGIASAACDALGAALYGLRASDLPQSAQERDALARLWEREAVLSNAILLLECDDAVEAALTFADELRTALLLGTREPLSLRTRALARVDVRSARWQSPQALRAANLLALGTARIERLAQRIEPVATWDDIVLPPAQLNTLREIATHARQCETVYNQWGFAARSARGLGITALFSGASGTGKTMAAEVLANDLQLELYRIDLSAVVSKYIGETEKNLRQVFDAAEQSGAILLFDEADALFGKRSEVKDSHDRYANIEISYLLQRMEAYHGLAILTTNMKTALDPAFARRIRFVVNFPFPDTAQRAQIWERIFPRETPTRGLETSKLARLNVAGGHIRNIALHAAFHAADAAQPVQMTHVLHAARGEYAKLEKPLTESEIGDWRVESA